MQKNTTTPRGTQPRTCERCGRTNHPDQPNNDEYIAPRFSAEAGRVMMLCGKCSW